jgi:hypothetical protein
METKRLQRIASRIAAGKGSPETEGTQAAPVTGVTKTVDIPDVGQAKVTLTKAGGIHERYWRDVEYDVVLPGEKSPISVTCVGGDRMRDDVTYSDPEAGKRLDALLEPLGWRPFDLAAQAVQQIADEFYSSRSEETPEFFDVEDGFILLHEEGPAEGVV